MPHYLRAIIRAVASLAGLLGVLFAGQVFAQDPSSVPILTQAVRSGWVRFDIAAGRVVLAGLAVGNISTSSAGNERSEQFSIQNENGEPSMKYERTIANGEKLSINISQGNRLRIVRSGKPGAKAMPLELVQSPNEPLSLVIEPEGRRQTYRAASLWHLLVTQPEACRQQVVPLLELLRPEWKLGKVSEAVEKELMRAAAAGVQPDRARWAELIQQLGDEQFAKREAADRELHAVGPVVLSYLQQLDFSRLDAEQQFRVRRIVARLSARIGGDAADQIALWLSGDASVWLALLARPEESTRRLAARQLAAILAEPVGFDAGAEPAVRERQIERLRARIEGKEKVAEESKRGRR